LIGTAVNAIFHYILISCAGLQLRYEVASANVHVLGCRLCSISTGTVQPLLQRVTKLVKSTYKYNKSL